MPLDSHGLLVSQGWQGKGSALRHGAINRPIAIPQKRTLAGVGKDRDEAFPFWDHLFSAASSSIRIKIASDDDDDNAAKADEDGNEDSHVSPSQPPILQRTQTGILSNRRPHHSQSSSQHHSSASSFSSNTTSTSKTSLLVTAKRQAARQNLYSRFLRGPVLTSDSDTHLSPTCPSPDPASSSLRKRKRRTSREIDDGHPAGVALDSTSKKSRRKAKKAKKQAKQLALAWMQNLQQHDTTPNVAPLPKKPVRKDTSIAEI